MQNSAGGPLGVDKRMMPSEQYDAPTPSDSSTWNELHKQARVQLTYNQSEWQKQGKFEKSTWIKLEMLKQSKTIIKTLTSFAGIHTEATSSGHWEMLD